MKPLSLVVAALCVACLFVGVQTSASAAWLLAVFSGLAAFAAWRAATMSTFLKIFVAIFAAETAIFGALSMISILGAWPSALADFELPDSLPLTVALFAFLTWASSHIPVVASIARISDHFFESRATTQARLWPFPAFQCPERWLAAVMVAFLVLLNQAQVAISVRLSFFSRDFFNALQAKDADTFWRLLLTVLPIWILIYVTSVVIEIIVQAMLTIRWRRYLTAFFLNRWLAGATHYRMSLMGDVDNPDQRISEDVNRFIDGGGFGGGVLSGYGVYTFTIQLIATMSSLVSFSIILWTLSADFTLPGYNIAVPGMLFWAALLYAVLGTVLTHAIGHTLPRLQFMHQRYEADFRFSLARVREYSEQVALLKGETTERERAMRHFRRIFDNFIEVTNVRKKINAFINFYNQIGGFIPFIVAAPFYFIGKIQFGVLNQTAQAFGNVDSSLKFFVSNYGALAEFKAVLDRLNGFDAAIDRAQTLEASPPIAPRASPDGAVHVQGLSLALPNGRKIIDAAAFVLQPHQSVLLSGPSGSGKSTLFRAIAGLWPFGSGAIETPQAASIMLLPQKPYIPIGSLRQAVAYPRDASEFDDAALRDALQAANLHDLIDRLDEDDNWQQRLSGGEQQRLSLARALLTKPDWLFLDESTASLDEPGEAALYATLAAKLPTTTIVSIGHRSTLGALHQRKLELRPHGDGVFSVEPIKAPSEPATS